MKGMSLLNEGEINSPSEHKRTSQVDLTRLMIEDNPDHTRLQLEEYPALKKTVVPQCRRDQVIRQLVAQSNGSYSVHQEDQKYKFCQKKVARVSLDKDHKVKNTLAGSF